jgi:hypothetical protein
MDVSLRYRDVDQISSAGCIARMGPKASEQSMPLEAQVRARMVDRVWFVGPTGDRAGGGRPPGHVCLLESHLRYGLICYAACLQATSLWGQFYEMWTDPTWR